MNSANPSSRTPLWLVVLPVFAVILMLAAATILAPAPVAKSGTGGPAKERLIAAEALSLDVVSLIDRGGCAACHTIPTLSNAVGTVGPSWCDPAGEYEEGKVNLDSLREMILDPNAEIAPGFAPNLMPQDFATIFSEVEIDALVGYISTLSCAK